MIDLFSIYDNIKNDRELIISIYFMLYDRCVLNFYIKSEDIIISFEKDNIAFTHNKDIIYVSHNKRTDDLYIFSAMNVSTDMKFSELINFIRAYNIQKILK